MAAAGIMFVLGACDNSSDVPLYGDPPVYPAIDGYPAWSPDGLKIVYNHAGITQISEGGAYFINPDSAGLWMMNADGSGQQLFIKGDYFDADWSPDGRWLVLNSGHQIFKVTLARDSLVQLTFSGRNFFPAWSPDGKWIAYDSDVNSGGPQLIWKMLNDGSLKIDISEHGTGEWRSPAWSPSGGYILYQRFMGIGTPEVFLMDTAGNNSMRLTFNTIEERFPKYSPDGNQIAYWSTDRYQGGVWVMGADGSNPKRLTDKGTDKPSWSPDGAKIAFVGWTDIEFNPRNNGTIWIMNSDGSNKHQLTYGPDQ